MDVPLHDAVIGLGSNLGDRRANLRGAVQALSELGEVVAVSALYETAPLGPPQPDYLNAAVRLRTPLVPWSYAASNLYHNWYWYPLMGKKRINKMMDTEWGRLFQSY